MMDSRQEIITPEIAARYLENNVANRPIQQKTVKNYARDMLSGKWELNGQGISFYENGNLADGQHRLNAIIEAGIPVEMYVTYGVPNSSFIHDRGRGRTMSNILSMNGFSTSIASNVLVGCINFMFFLCGKEKPTDQIVMDFCKENETLLSKCVSITCSGSTHPLCKKAPLIAATFCALYCGIDANVLRDFYSIANTGFYSDKGQTAAIVLRNFLINEFKSNNNLSKRQCFMITTNAIKNYVSCTPRQKPYRSDTKFEYFDDVKSDILDKYIESYI